MSDYNSSLPIRTENAGDAIVKVADATITSQQLAINSDGSVNITDNGASITVDATNLDIRDLSHAQDSVKVGDGTDFLAVNADGSVNITDNGGSLTVDATNLDIRDLSASQDNVAISDGTDTLAVNADGSINSIVSQATHDNLNANVTIQVGDVDVGNANPVPVSDAGGSLTVDAINLDIRDLSHTQDSVKIGDGTDFLAVNADGSINVVPLEDPGTERVDYNTAAALAASASSNHDYTLTNAAKLYQVLATASSKLKVEVQIETGSATGVFNTVMVGFNSSATPNINLALSKYAAIPAGARVRVIRTNKDNQAQDVYSTIVALES